MHGTNENHYYRESCICHTTTLETNDTCRYSKLFSILGDFWTLISEWLEQYLSPHWYYEIAQQITFAEASPFFLSIKK